MTTMITGTAGSISHGEMATVWTFWACCSNTPQLMAGGRRPRPRKLRAGPLMLMAGGGGGEGPTVGGVKHGAMWAKVVALRLQPLRRHRAPKAPPRPRAD